MKLLIITLILWGGSTVAHAQLANTKWSGSMAVPELTEVTLEFKKDTVNVALTNSGDVIETATYSINGNIITLKKISGGSPCEIGSVSTLRYVLKENELTISVENDPCGPRAKAWPDEPFKKTI